MCPGDAFDLQWIEVPKHRFLDKKKTKIASDFGALKRASVQVPKVISEAPDFDPPVLYTL